MKNSLRKSMLARRSAMRMEDVEHLGSEIQRRIIESELFAAAQSIGSYLRLGNEVPTDSINRAGHASNKVLAVPFRPKARNQYYFVRLEADAEIEEGADGACQPAGAPKVHIADIDLMLLPGVAFSRRGERLGRGGAVYDRLLAAAGATKVGLCYGFQIEEDVPCEPHDQRVDWIATEDEFFKVECNIK